MTIDNHSKTHNHRSLDHAWTVVAAEGQTHRVMITDRPTQCPGRGEWCARPDNARKIDAIEWRNDTRLVRGYLARNRRIANATTTRSQVLTCRVRQVWQSYRAQRERKQRNANAEDEDAGSRMAVSTVTAFCFLSLRKGNTR